MRTDKPGIPLPHVKMTRTTRKLAEVYLLVESFETAAMTAKQAVELAKKANLGIELGLAQLVLSESLLGAGREGQAREALFQALPINWEF